VSANAGTGKTHVLTLRVLRLMLAGTLPERIHCLTYTKAAAAEMSKRVFDTLARWVTAPDGALGRELAELCARAPRREDLAYARTLFTAAIETPGGLKVQTIHSFCERLLQRFPLEANVAPGFSILDEARPIAEREAIDDAGHATANTSPEARRSLCDPLAEDRFEDILRPPCASGGSRRRCTRRRGAPAVETHRRALLLRRQRGDMTASCRLIATPSSRVRHAPSRGASDRNAGTIAPHSPRAPGPASRRWGYFGHGQGAHAC
jgi:hypothetical protein